ncbi:MAG: hypothetical protein M0Z76_06685 [Gammaproteobacteria bacterium]|nr:hypothetical protein [Gammaproteobacteria bacterium]
MSALLVVYGMDALSRACREASDLLALSQRKGAHCETESSLIGIVIGPDGADPVAARSNTCAVLESAGIQDVWTLLWLGFPAGMSAAQRRRRIVCGLDETGAEGDECGVPVRFAPVFAAGADAKAVQAEIAYLSRGCTRLLMPAVFQDPLTQRLMVFNGSVQ